MSPISLATKEPGQTASTPRKTSADEQIVDLPPATHCAMCFRHISSFCRWQMNHTRSCDKRPESSGCREGACRQKSGGFGRWRGSQLCHFGIVWPQTTYIPTFLSFPFPSQEAGIIITGLLCFCRHMIMSQRCRILSRGREE